MISKQKRGGVVCVILSFGSYVQCVVGTSFYFFELMLAPLSRSPLSCREYSLYHNLLPLAPVRIFSLSPLNLVPFFDFGK